MLGESLSGEGEWGTGGMGTLVGCVHIRAVERGYLERGG